MVVNGNFMDFKFEYDGVPVTILRGPYLVDEVPTSKAMALIAALTARLDEIRHYAARKGLLHLYNRFWLDENCGPLDEESFVSKLTHPSLVLMDEFGAATIYFDDSDMFAGHWIEVFVYRGELFSANIIG